MDPSRSFDVLVAVATASSRDPARTAWTSCSSVCWASWECCAVLSFDADGGVMLSSWLHPVIPPSSTARTTNSTEPPARNGRAALLVESGSRAHSTDVRHVVKSGDDDSGAGVERIHDLPVADVHADVTDRAVVEDQVTGLKLALGDVPT